MPHTRAVPPLRRVLRLLYGTARPTLDEILGPETNHTSLSPSAAEAIATVVPAILRSGPPRTTRSF